MKPLLISVFLLFSASGFSQVIDSAEVVKDIDSLIHFSSVLTEKREFDQALALNIDAEKIALENFGRESMEYGNCCFNHGRILYINGTYSESEKWYVESKEIRAKVLGKEHPKYAICLFSLAELYFRIGKYEKCEPLYIEAKDIQEKSLGKEHSDYAWTLNGLANLYTVLGKYESAESLFLEAKAILEKTLGKEHKDMPWCLTSMANLYTYIGNYEKSVSLLLEAKDIWGKTLGKTNPNYSGTLNNLGALYVLLGNYEKAEPLLIEAKYIDEKTIGRNNPDYASTLLSLALLYESMGKYEKCESLYLESISILEISLGKDSPNYSMALFNVSNLYINTGQFKKAETTLLECKSIYEKSIGIDNLDYVAALNSLSIVYKETGQYKPAESLYLEAKSICEKILGKENQDYAISVLNLANLYATMGVYEKAEPLYYESTLILGNSLGLEHPVYALSLTNLANLENRLRNYEKAESLLLQAKNILEKSLGEENPDYIWSLYNLADLYSNIGMYAKAEPIFLKLANANQALIIKLFYYFSERELFNYIKTFVESQNQMLSFTQMTQNKRTISACYDNILFYKGFILNAFSQINRYIYRDSASIEKLDSLRGYCRRLAGLYTLPKFEQDSLTVSELEEKANSLEKNLIHTVTGYGALMQQVKWQEVKQHLKTNETAIEFINYSFDDSRIKDSILYVALLLKPGDEAPQFIPLFEERELTTLLKDVSRKAIGKINALYAGEDAKRLYELIWKPLEPFLSGVKTVYVSPSGLLNRLNLSAISVDSSSTIGDRYRIVTLGSTRQLVLSDTASRSGADAVLVGGVRYTSDTIAMVAVNATIAPKDWSTDVPFHQDTVTRGGSWTYLPETALEVQDINSLFQSAGWTSTLDTGFRATEEVFRSIGQGNPSPRVLHVATHGFFFPDPRENPKNEFRNLPSDQPVFRLSEHPMIRSGLLLAGADKAWSTGKPPQNREDGILTAYEISQMNLSNTELVVLSACETGLGEIEGNEGVYGLQRAFKIAGAKYLIMSLWEVSDKATRELMTGFYRRWLVDKLEIPEAFRLAQRDLRKNHPTSPYLWAGFVLVE